MHMRISLIKNARVIFRKKVNSIFFVVYHISGEVGRARVIPISPKTVAGFT